MTASTDCLFRRNRRLARQRWGPAINLDLLETLKSFSKEFCFSISSGDLLLLDKRWYVTHVGLIRLARRNRCHGVLAEPAQEFCDPKVGRWVFRATVYKSRTCGGFVGYGDADPSNVSSLVHGAEMRIAETRAVNRALRKAYGIGICSVEEIGTIPISIPTEKFPPAKANGSSNGTGPKVRDRLCQIIRQHQLNPELVKAYAIDFCGTKTLREASREQVKNFVLQLAKRAESDRNGLLGKLNTYTHPKQEGAA
ncbi:MAG TPA: hypothetical protein VK574_03720 [Terracidiphilus sp.]|nr:hypothetical protein [Terracidiphilus sp.]